MNMFKRSVMLAGAVLGCAVAFGPAASAASPLPGSPSQHDIGVLNKLTASSAVVNRLASTSFPGGTHAKMAARGNVSVDRDQIPVYAPTADFVAGKSTVPAKLAYVATPASTGTGQPATLWAKRAGSSWRVFNVASGSDEQHYAARADGGYLLNEPQINGWYAVHGQTVTALHAAGVKDGTTMSLAAYQKELAKRYGDKLPGSKYAHEGMAGGYGDSPVSDGGRGWPWMRTALLGGGGLVVLGAGGVALRRRS